MPNAVGFTRRSGRTTNVGGCLDAGPTRAHPQRYRNVDLYDELNVYTGHVAKHLVDIDEQALSAARAELGTSTIRDTVNEALNLAAGTRSTEVKRALDRLALLELDDREDVWR